MVKLFYDLTLHHALFAKLRKSSAVASLRGRGGCYRSRWHHPGWWHPNESQNICCGWIFKNTGQTITWKCGDRGCEWWQ